MNVFLARDRRSLWDILMPGMPGMLLFLVVLFVLVEPMKVGKYNTQNCGEE